MAGASFRRWGHWTHSPATPRPDAQMWAHAHAEDHIHRLKDPGLSLPLQDLDANRAWLATVCFADTLVRFGTTKGLRPPRTV